MGLLNLGLATTLGATINLDYPAGSRIRCLQYLLIYIFHNFFEIIKAVQLELQMQLFFKLTGRKLVKLICCLILYLFDHSENLNSVIIDLLLGGLCICFISSFSISCLIILYRIQIISIYIVLYVQLFVFLTLVNLFRVCFDHRPT